MRWTVRVSATLHSHTLNTDQPRRRNWAATLRSLRLLVATLFDQKTEFVRGAL
jgi:hypothetical protein